MKRLDRLKTAFLAQVSHKLKTPLTSLSLGLQELERYAAGLFPGDPCHQRLSSMREDMIKLSGAISSIFRMQEVMVGQGGARIRYDLAELVQEALAQVASRTGQHGVVLHFVELPLIMVDHDRLLFAFQQILDNAFKFSSSQGVVTVSLEKDAAAVRLVVEDTGCGISKEELPKIFRQFYQIDPDATGQIPGFGVGLYCTREIVRQHGGSVAVESNEGTGTKVTVTLPCPEAGACSSVKKQAVVGGYCMCEFFSETLISLPI